ncbi:hypothetical protein N5J77_00445 [Sphingobium yanoikuyae]|jgi:hypothetical protein|uniref:Uncharacterized protein n=1 Tax=Sphingobium yanoikuyae TaxID=13690 RepID=A0AA42WPT0_SPHYA|nr:MULTISPECIES: hypothetical protein [Sphingobium]KMW29362.1 hypothetical protein BV87_14665 [Sphingobium yanoikuyae]MDH2129575.1 hypothetical protein [Sphingobium yanoikuyae]MDH2148996.1 hypothetical protein [Sphingobium yanoikuyae]MDH2167698.1 hypothetical protein [Sphingobium yanoikuyae]WIA54871.1 hypothetical protein N6H05_17680 [Sphingobium sp. WTD-1]
MTAESGRAQADCPRSTRAEVRNPVLALPAAGILATIDPDMRALLALLFGDLQQDARARAHQNWNRHKAVMAAYWSAVATVATYAGHIRRTLYGPAGHRNRTPLLLRQQGYSPIPVRDWAEASRCYCQRRDRSGLGARDFVEAELTIGDTVIARISYNGRIWLAGDWQPGDTPLYDNAASNLRLP